MSKPIIGMLHLAPLPGAPAFDGDPNAIREHVLADARALAEGGVDGLMIENFGDTPFYPGKVPVYVVAHMTAVAAEVRRAVDLPVGINVLRNDGCAAAAIAHAVGADFIRVNVLCGARLTDQGLVQGVAHDLLRLRAALGATNVKILADVNVKHSTPLGMPRPVAGEVGDLIHRGGADALIVSGDATGKPADLDEINRVMQAAGDTPVLIGSGVTLTTIRELLARADGAIVGTALKVDGLATNPVDPDSVKAIISAARQ